MWLRVMTYNIKDGGTGRLDAIQQVIQSRMATEAQYVVALIEATNRENVETLGDKLQMTYAYGIGKNSKHLAWLSTTDQIRIGALRFSKVARPAAEVSASIDHRHIRIFLLHLHKGTTQEAEDRRTQRLERLVSRLRALGDQPHLVVGDFNSVCKGEGKRQNLGYEPAALTMLIRSRYMDCYRKYHTFPDDPGYTYVGTAPDRRIDYILASPALAPCLTACEVVDTPAARAASDHLPVWADFDLSRL